MLHYIPAFEQQIKKLAIGCWIWTGYVMPNGYGEYGRKLAHRVSYEIYTGPIPEGLHILHKCDLKICVNPEHLYAGTPADNTRDRMLVFEPRKVCKQGHDLTGDNLRKYKRRNGWKYRCKICDNLMQQLRRQR